MSILNLNSPQGRGPRGKKTTKIWMGVGLLVAVLGVGSTFASTITINPAGSTEFGQGVETTVYCGKDAQTLVVAPVSGYKNDSGEDGKGTFYLSGFLVSKIPAACDGVNFVISMYDDATTSTPIEIATKSGSAALATPTVYWRTGKSIASGGKGPIDTEKYVATPNSSTACQTGSTPVTSPASSKNIYGGILSLSRATYVSPCAVAYLTALSSDSFQINVMSGATNRSIGTAARIVVETQNDAIFSSTAGALMGFVKF